MGYGVTWVSEVMSMTHSSKNSVNGGIPLKTIPERLLIYTNTLTLVSMTKSVLRMMVVYILVNTGVG